VRLRDQLLDLTARGFAPLNRPWLARPPILDYAFPA
jgi:hypothetical protein